MRTLESPTTPRTVVNEAYTVGLVCALTTEYVAACEVLDEEHDMLQHSSSNDDNVYTLGRIGSHNVVIAVMPSGEYGTTSAALTARDMLRSFSNIKIGLMVGVGGGVPSTKHDIRLGDVVVSNPDSGRGGVYQYDFGKEVQGEPFRNSGFLNQPPRSLRAAVTTLMGKHERKGNRIDKSVALLLDKNKRLREKYSRPNPNTERLYKASYIHRPDHHTACNIECGDNPENLVKRELRDKDEDIVSIHYGLIASSNKVIKDATFRDRLAKQEGMLCFEIEGAAGLMNHFPCLIIRGICDYSDSHKNKAWQGYAAMTAAVYAKDLLAQIAPTAIQSEREISEFITSGWLNNKNQEIYANIVAVKQTQKM